MVAAPSLNRYVGSATPISPSDASSESLTTSSCSKVKYISVADTHQFANSSPLRHQQRTSWNHWQLRDVVICPTSKSELYSIYRCNVDKYDTRKHQSTRILENLGFDPVSVAVGGDYIVVGGQRAELAVAKLSSPEAVTVVQSGGSINNFVALDCSPPPLPLTGRRIANTAHIGLRRLRDSGYIEDGVTNLNILHDHQHEPRLLVCNNDHSVRVFSLPELEIVKELKFPVAINYASVSPDGSKMCVVGDSNNVFLFNKRGDDFENIATLTASNDASFSCDWNQTSDMFAVGSQDGFVNVWDIRSQHKLVSLETYQHGRSRGACRNVKFSPSGSIDLLAFSEHTGFVNIVDTRGFEKRQILHISQQDSPNTEVEALRNDSDPQIHQELQITGLRFAPDSSSLFVGTEDSILEYSIDTIGRYSFASSSVI